ncbi:hypothetical protein [Micromonospora sp. NPDC005206]|uniref:hypothetical protein n=1 Tax=Micromonospora sp. NPDC005206 TaxID=3157022 RepID=UPI0033B3827E
MVDLDAAQWWWWLLPALRLMPRPVRWHKVRSMEAMRALKRRLSNVIYARMVADQKRRQAADPGGHSGTPRPTISG